MADEESDFCEIDEKEAAEEAAEREALITMMEIIDG